MKNQYIDLTNLPLVIDEMDILRCALDDPTMTNETLEDATGMTSDIIRAASDFSTALNASHSRGWFSIKTCSPEFIRNRIYHKGETEAVFWRGVCDGYRTGVKLREPRFLLHATDMLNKYAERILAQIQCAKLPGGQSYPEKQDIMNALMSIPVSGSNNPIRAIMDYIGSVYGTTVGIGDFIVASDLEQGFWNNDLGWVENKDAATPFDSRKDIYLTPGLDSKVVSYTTAQDYRRDIPKMKI
jgi:hypothetical protein